MTQHPPTREQLRHTRTRLRVIQSVAVANLAVLGWALYDVGGWVVLGMGVVAVALTVVLCALDLVLDTVPKGGEHPTPPA